MLKRLLRSIIGEFPPKHVPLCDTCRTAYTVAGIIKPPYSFNRMVASIYHFGLLCENPCGNFVKPHRQPPQNPANHKWTEIMERFEIDCKQCQTAILTMSFLVENEIDAVDIVTPKLLEKQLICKECYSEYGFNSLSILKLITWELEDTQWKHNTL